MNRLFDIVNNLAKEQPEQPMLGYKDNGKWKQLLYKDVVLQAQNIASSLLDALGVAPKGANASEREKVAIISNNRPEWLIVDLAVQQAGAILTPIYPTVSCHDLLYILKDAEVKYVFVSNEEIYNRFKEVLDGSEFTVYSFDRIQGLAHYKSLCVQPSSEEKLKQSIANIDKDDVATIIYTSGTTGNPKGVMLTHNNIYSNAASCVHLLESVVKPGEKCLSFLPLNHIFERTVTYMYIILKLNINYAESIDTIGDNIREVKPVLFTSVPRVIEKVYDKIVAKGKELSGIKKAIFFWAIRLAKRYDHRVNQGGFYNFKLNIADKLIFSKWRTALGGQTKAIISGSAALNPKLIRIFSAAKITIMEGYGLTETSPVISVNSYVKEDRYIGTVGTLVKEVQVKLAEDGEILCKGPNVMRGYYKDEEQTKEAFTKDGWLKTGDIGTFVEGRFLKITDRKKSMFKTSGGKYVVPQYVENVYRSNAVIEQILIVGAGKKFVAALIVPNWDLVERELNDRKPLSSEEREKWANGDQLNQYIAEALAENNNQINHVEQVKRFKLLVEPWTVDNGLLTPKLSKKRSVIEKRFAKEVALIYKV